jgi:hypothetical protein
MIEAIGEARKKAAFARRYLAACVRAQLGVAATGLFGRDEAGSADRCKY